MSAIEMELKDCRATYDALAEKHKALLAERDELAEALRDILAAHNWPTEPHWTRARSLLARLEGGEK